MQDLSFTFPRVSVFAPHRYVSRVFTPSEGPDLPVSQICIYSDLCIDFISNLDNTIKDLLRFLREYTINTCSCCVNAFSYQQKCSFRFADILLYITKEFVVMEHENKYQQKVFTFQKIECVKMCFIPGYFDYKTDYRRINSPKWIIFKKQLYLIKSKLCWKTSES